MVAAGPGLHAASGWRARTWQTEEGLPDNSVTGVQQTSDGYLWVATLGGLMRYNGARFQEVPLLNVPGVVNRVVRRLFLDHRGRLWLAMDRGAVLCLDTNQTRVYAQNDGLENSRINNIVEDGAGAIWLAANAAVYRIDDRGVFRFGAGEGIPAGGNPWLATDRLGRLWFARGSQVSVYRGQTWHNVLSLDHAPVRLCPASDGAMWISSGPAILKYAEGGQAEERARLPEKAGVTMLFEDSRGTLWVGTMAGLFNLEGSQLRSVETSQAEILCAFEDRENNLWIGTGGGGLNLLHPQPSRLLGAADGLPSEDLRSLCQDTDGWFWAAMNNGALMRGRGREWKVLTAADGWPGGDGDCVVAGKEGGVWVGTRDHGLVYWRDGQCQQWGREAGLGSDFIHALLVGSDGAVWAATHLPDRLVCFRQGRFRFVDPPGDVRVIRALAEGTNGTIWAGTSGGQLLRVEGNALVPEPLVTEARPLSVRSLHVTADGSLWIGYAGWGLGRFWAGHYARLTMKDGLYDDYISQIQSDDQGGLWLTSNHGLYETRLRDTEAATEGGAQRVRSIVFGRGEGLASLQPVYDFRPNTLRTADGQLWFATRNGLLQVQPGLIRDNTNPPPVMLERVAVDDRTVAVWDNFASLRAGAETNAVDLRGGQPRLALRPGHRKIEFEFAALSYTSPENVSFRYRLRNYDAEWIEAGGQRTVKYPQLAAGDYGFEVQACNNAGVWNEAGYSLDLRVAPFMWQTLWFRLAALAGFTAGVIGLVRYFSFRRLQRRLAQLVQQAALQRERSRIARDMHDEVGAKLSRLSLLTEMAGQQPELPAAVRGDVVEISETARDTIRAFEQIVWAVNPKNDSLPDLVNYLCRFAEDLFEGSETQCAFEVPAEIPALELSTDIRHHIFLAAKEALNNAFKHARARHVRLQMRFTAAEFQIHIADDGAGFAPAGATGRPGGGNGLGNMRERMKSAGGRMEIVTEPGRGTTVKFSVRVPAPRA